MFFRNDDYMFFATPPMLIDPAEPAIQCLDVTDGDPHKWVQGYECGFRWPAGNHNQYWRRYTYGAPKYLREQIMWVPDGYDPTSSVMAKWCLAAGANILGAPVVLQRCNAQDDMQFWHVIPFPME